MGRHPHKGAGRKLVYSPRKAVTLDGVAPVGKTIPRSGFCRHSMIPVSAYDGKCKVPPRPRTSVTWDGSDTLRKVSGIGAGRLRLCLLIFTWLAPCAGLFTLSWPRF